MQVIVMGEPLEGVAEDEVAAEGRLSSPSVLIRVTFQKVTEPAAPLFVAVGVVLFGAAVDRVAKLQKVAETCVIYLGA